MEAIVYFGSFICNQYDKFSDLDIFVYLNDRGNITEEKKMVRKYIINILDSIDENIYLDFDRNDKWVIYIQNNLTKLEIQIKSIFNAKEDIIYIAESRIKTPEKAIVFDRNDKILQIYKSNWIYMNNLERLKRIFEE